MKLAFAMKMRVWLSIMMMFMFVTLASAENGAEASAKPPETSVNLTGTAARLPESSIQASTQARVETMLNKEKIDNARLHRHSFLIVGGFWSFLVWVLLFVNTIFTVFFIIITMSNVRRNRIFPKELIQRVQQVLGDGELGFAMEACVPSDTPLARILFEAFKNIGDGFDACRDAMNTALKAEKEKLMKPVCALVACAILSIGLGMICTVLGLMKTLDVFAANPEIGSFQEMAYASGQTFYSLIIGILCACAAFLLYNYAASKVNRIIINTEKLAIDLVKVLRGAHVHGNLQSITTMTQLLDYNSMNNIPPDSRV
ncbi:MAG: MotA/TolQ/ExbB proton channel family protein [Victivallaceae bacterium]